jgi:hypothetical protein
MQISLNIPLAPTTPPVAQIQVLSHTFYLNNNTIHLVWNELDGYSNIITGKEIILSTDQTTTFFTTSVGVAVTLQDVFDAAVAATLATIYGPLTITSP